MNRVKKKYYLFALSHANQKKNERRARAKAKNEARQNEAMGKIQFAREKRKSKWSNGVTQIAWCLWGTTHIVAIHFDTMQFIALHSLLAL